jgi:cobalt/nickel transport system permease protein
MHIPDGFLSTGIWIGMWIVSIIIIGYSVSKVNKKLGDKHIPLMGILAAFIFAAQMLNAPVAAGTSGHMLGGVLAASFLGAFAASVIMAAVFIVQAVFFQDGGITALGANIFNMGLIGTIFGYYVYRGIRRVIGEDSKKGILIGIGVAAWLSVVLASAAVSIELAASGIFPLKESLIAMVGVHSIIGLIEAGITITVVLFVLKVRPDLFNLEKI